MKIDFDEPSGIGWACIAAVIGIVIVLITGVVSDYYENTTKMALEAGCSESVIPESSHVYWSNCTKGLPPSK